jgi:hypothetical protein
MNLADVFLGKCIATVRLERTNRSRDRGWARLRYAASIWSKGWRMEFKDYDFSRNPVVQNQAFFLESKCAFCGFSILARSIEELAELEELHRMQCRPSKTAA